MVKSDVFEKYALEYDGWFERHKVEYALELDAIRMLLPVGVTGVEIGAGTGRFMQPLGVSLGIEPARAMRVLAADRGANVIAGTAESLPIGDSSYDFALLVTTVCFLDSLDRAFREIYRILKTGGFIIIGLIDSESPLGKKYNENKSESKFYVDVHFHSVKEIQVELENAKFTNFEYVQALLPGDVGDNKEPGIKQGYGEGSFVVLRAQKNRNN